MKINVETNYFCSPECKYFSLSEESSLDITGDEIKSFKCENIDICANALKEYDKFYALAR